MGENEGGRQRETMLTKVEIEQKAVYQGVFSFYLYFTVVTSPSVNEPHRTSASLAAAAGSKTKPSTGDIINHIKRLLLGVPEYPHGTGITVPSKGKAQLRPRPI